MQVKETELGRLSQRPHNRGHSEIVKVLLANGADVDKADGYYTPLYYAIWNNDNVTVRALIDAGADVNIVPHEKDYSPVAYAIWQGHVDNVKTLLEAGADLNVKDQEGLTPFYWAAFSGYKNILDLILSKRDWPDTIHLAAYRGNLDKVTTLIEEGTEVNVEDAFACTPLHWAALADSPAVADYLIAKGADLEARDKGSWTAPYECTHFAGRGITGGQRCRHQRQKRTTRVDEAPDGMCGWRQRCHGVSPQQDRRCERQRREWWIAPRARRQSWAHGYS